MEAIEFLKQEHQKAKAAFGKVLQAAPHERGRLWKELKPELEVHEQVEEACVYGPVAEQASSREPKLVEWRQHHREEVQKVEALMKDIERLSPEDANWLPAVKQVHSMLEHHIREEEGEIFPRIGQVWDKSRLEQAGTKMQELKSEKLHQHA